MKKNYFILFALIISVILFFSLNFIKIPSPSSLIKEEYQLEIQ